MNGKQTCAIQCEDTMEILHAKFLNDFQVVILTDIETMTDEQRESILNCGLKVKEKMREFFN